LIRGRSASARNACKIEHVVKSIGGNKFGFRVRGEGLKISKTEAKMTDFLSC